MNAKKIAETIFDVADRLYKIIEKIPRTEILNQEAVIDSSNSTVEYSIALSLPPNFQSSSHIHILEPSIIRASIVALFPLPGTIRGAIRRLPTNDGYVILPEVIPSECEIISVNITYKVENAKLIDDLVDTSSTHDPGGVDRNEYWMHAQLKQPKVLANKFGKFDVRDVDVTVAVQIQEQLRTTIPNPFIQRLKILYEVMNETDPRKQFKAIPKLRRLSRSDTAGNEIKIIQEMESLFLPREFSKFFVVEKDFRYSSCYRGQDAYELPLNSIPKSMEVISRSDLSLDRYAAEGVLIYKHNEFREALAKLFE